MNMTPADDASRFRSHAVEVAESTIHVVESGVGPPTVLFLHGWPESWIAFERVMVLLGDDAHVVAMDLPGIGGSEGAPSANDKRTLAQYVHAVVEELHLKDVTLVGHDVGGQIAYAYLQRYPHELAGAVIMNTAIPGLDPWADVRRNPAIWHFAFHALPGLPEELVAGHEALYFAYFFDRIASDPTALTAPLRAAHVRAYSRPRALQTGFNWYRAFERDESDNARTRGRPITTPVLYLRGADEPGLPLERYLDGLVRAGLTRVEGRVIPNAGHFLPEEQPEAVADALRGFMRLGPAAASRGWMEEEDAAASPPPSH
jgi:pimeloyl-ACP methyl ester carboxylesterase